MSDAEARPPADGGRGDATDDVPDGALVRRVLAGDAEAFGRLYERHAEAIYRYLLLRTGSSALAEDLLQDVFEQALRKLSELREPDRLLAWLMRIAQNRLGNHWARRARRPDDAGPPNEATTPGGERPEQVLEPQLRVEALQLHRLPEREQQVLALRFGAGLPAREVAEQLGCSESAARQLQYRALKRLRALVREGEAES